MPKTPTKLKPDNQSDVISPWTPKTYASILAALSSPAVGYTPEIIRSAASLNSLNVPSGDYVPLAHISPSILSPQEAIEAESLYPEFDQSSGVSNLCNTFCEYSPSKPVSSYSLPSTCSADSLSDSSDAVSSSDSELYLASCLDGDSEEGYFFEEADCDEQYFACVKGGGLIPEDDFIPGVTPLQSSDIVRSNKRKERYYS